MLIFFAKGLPPFSTNPLFSVLDESRVSNSTPTLTALNPPEPRFSYLALSVSNTASIANLITINSQVNF